MLSSLDLFSVGIGPSSSHTVGPMRAAKLFTRDLVESGKLPWVHRVRVELLGSLGATGRGHGSDVAVMLGLLGEDPETVDTGSVRSLVAGIADTRTLLLAGEHIVPFSAEVDVVLNGRRTLTRHPNAMTMEAFDSDGDLLKSATYFSVGGGFIVTDSGDNDNDDAAASVTPPVPYPFSTGAELLERCAATGSRISEIMLANELVTRDEDELRAGLLGIWAVMRASVNAGCTSTDPLLPGRLKVPRRAPMLYSALTRREAAGGVTDPMDWLSLYALAVNEENAAGGRVVTAPTNGAAGIIPAVLHHYLRDTGDLPDDDIVSFLLTAAAIGTIFKTNASISGAEVGCQGEVGSACAMAAAAYCELMGGSAQQVENAAEIGIEHNLGLTCDPIGGLVQIPCIERNAIAAHKAIAAARLALHGNGNHRVSLDDAVATLRSTGADMSDKYKETSRGGLAVNVTEC